MKNITVAMDIDLHRILLEVKHLLKKEGSKIQYPVILKRALCSLKNELEKKIN